MTAIDWHEPDRRGEFTRWSVAALVVVAAHLALVGTYLLLRPAPDGGATAPVVDVQFMPPEAATAVTERVAPPLDQPKEAPPLPPPPLQSEATPPPEPLQAPPSPQVPAVLPTEPSPLAPAEPMAPAEALPQPESLPPPPAPVQKPAAALEVPPAPAKPVDTERPREKPAVAKPAHPRPKTQAEEKKPRPDDRRTTERREVQAPARIATAPNRGAVAAGSREAEAAWRSALVARLQRAKPSGQSQSGTVEVSFTMDRGGRVVSRRVARSSGSAALDQAALSMIDRAQPLPAFPAGMTEARKTLTVPVHFSMR